MKILCWNTDEAVWRHWNQVVNSHYSLVRTKDANDTRKLLESGVAQFEYCFVFLEHKAFSEHVMELVKLRQAYPKIKLVAFPNRRSQQAALTLLASGVNGQCSPYIGREQLALVLSVIDSGEIWGGKEFIQQLIQQTSNVYESASDYAEIDGLSEKENDVANHISSGLTNKQIASEMGITERTVKAHVSAIFKKTNTKDRLSLALLVQKSHSVH
ncbi:response regulator transcription factor [Marinomonas epiphytica]